MKRNSCENVSIVLEVITAVLKPISTLPRKKEIMLVSKKCTALIVFLILQGQTEKRTTFSFTYLAACAELLLKLCSSFELASFAS